jgi:hypothetical protein
MEYGPKIDKLRLLDMGGLEPGAWRKRVDLSRCHVSTASLSPSKDTLAPLPDILLKGKYVVESRRPNSNVELALRARVRRMSD